VHNGCQSILLSPLAEHFVRASTRLMNSAHDLLADPTGPAAASSVAALNLLRLAQIRNEGALRERAERAIAAFTPQISHFPSAMPQMLVALDCSLNTPRQIVIAGKRDARDTRALLAEVHQHFLSNTVVLLADGGTGQRFLEEKLEALTDMAPLKAKATAYVCENFACQAPVTSTDALRELLPDERPGAGAGWPRNRRRR
jgi:hypothetical protein